MKDKDFELKILHNIVKNKQHRNFELKISNNKPKPMSTIFGILKEGIAPFELENDCLPEKYNIIKDSVFVIIAYRTNGGGFYTTTESMGDLLYLFPNDIKVYPLDNSAQGVYTILDIKQNLKN